MNLTKKELLSLRHPSEKPKFILTIFVLLPITLLLAGVVIATNGTMIITLPFIIFSIWFATKLFIAGCMTNKVLVNEKNFPKADKAIKQACAFFGYDEPISAYVYDDGSYSLTLIPMLKSKVLLLNSELFKNGNSDEELKFLVGRYVGALASKHYRFLWLQGLLNGVEKLMLFNILLYPYERATKLSGDRMGLALIDGDINVAVYSMIKMIVGADIADKIDLKSFLAQEETFSSSFFCKLRNILSPFPHHTTRVSELIKFTQEKYPYQIGVMRGFI